MIVNLAGTVWVGYFASRVDFPVLPQVSTLGGFMVGYAYDYTNRYREKRDGNG